jgi:murein DD-endopeptidase MepM/ murein hydrolase activator NlpD
MGKMDREIKLQQSSFVEIKDQFESKKDLIAHTPSIRPVEGGYFSSGFGKRRDPFNGRWEIHSGLDISVGRGTPVCATADGEVVFAKRTPGLGNLVIVDHGYGFTTAYGHMSRFNVGLGARVTRGQKIGEVGNTGRSTAPHLHYQVSVMDNAVDPRDYIFEPNAIEYARR